MISPEDTYPGRTTPANPAYPEGSIQNETIPDSSNDGTPLDELWGNDFEGFKQAVARSAGIVPTPPGNVPDTAELSQILQSLIEIISGRAFTYDDASISLNTYILDVQTNQQAPQSLFDGLIVEFVAIFTNTGASTIDPAGLGVRNISGTDSAGAIVAGQRYKLIFNATSNEWEIIPRKETVVPDNISGLLISNDTDSLHDISVSAGQCADTTGAVTLKLPSLLVKQIDAPWIAGNNVGGRFSGVALTPNTWYYLTLIKKDSDGSIDWGYDDNTIGTNLPVGYTAFRIFGAILTDGVSDIIPFSSRILTSGALEIYWDIPPLDVDVAQTNIVSQDLYTLSVPPQICTAILNFYHSGSNEEVWIKNPAQDDTATPNFSTSPLMTGFANARAHGNINIVTDSSGRIGVRTSYSGTTVRIATLGYIQERL